jgi:hypothetical protein
MAGEPIDNRSLMRRTLITVGAMVGGSVVLVGTLTLVASSVAGRVVAPSASDSSGSTSSTHGASSAVKTPPQGATKVK